GAIALFCASAGVEPQSEKVWQQASRYKVPRICFINKMDKIGADFLAVVAEINTKLEAKAVPIQLPMGAEKDFTGVVDLITLRAYVWDKQEDGKTYEVTAIPPAMQEEVQHWRNHLLEQLAGEDLILMEQYLENPNEVSVSTIQEALRRATLAQRIFPVLCGTAFKKKGIQPLLDAVAAYLPSPVDQVQVTGTHPEREEVIIRKVDEEEAFTGLVFKIVADDYMGKMSFTRIYAGTLRVGETIWNMRTGQKGRISKLFRIVSNQYVSLEVAQAGDICAIVGLKEVRTGDTLATKEQPILLEAIQFPVPVFGYAIEARNQEEMATLMAALKRKLEEDPTLRLEYNDQTGQQVLLGMGELHLDVVLEKIEADNDIAVQKGKPQVSYREMLTKQVHHKATLKNQNGGSGQFAEIVFELIPLLSDKEGLVFVDELKGNNLPRAFVPFIKKGFLQAMQQGILTGSPVNALEVRLLDGKSHEEDSHGYDFTLVAQQGFKEAALQAVARLMEPMMKVTISSPETYVGAIIGDLNRRRGVIQALATEQSWQQVQALVPLVELFGYITTI
ncbi:MAG: elongation factor G, partial [Bacteroidota bacterium]